MMVIMSFSELLCAVCSCGAACVGYFVLYAPVELCGLFCAVCSCGAVWVILCCMLLWSCVGYFVLYAPVELCEIFCAV